MSDNVYLAYDYPLLGAFWTILVIALWVWWFILLFRVIADIFRDDALSGWAKAGWLVLTLLLPFLGVFIYVLARGRSMGARERRHVQAQQEAFDQHVREAAGGTGRRSEADELMKLSEIRARGDISDEEFRRAKEKILH
ncbi:SHOCT domain-containing protein [Streptomyces triculaminicus]|uniref:SHOCT domain-containing protein n=2 Tax=Streptomyces TaxID=1883 RepID=A0A939FQG9_9ACTN|nr:MULTISPECIES: SHOCT domain-containing protein [Streptomyces]MBO0655958.1 SHOCT domain-containing protein [Streptomyces triculaminicus]QSY49955.1 SHOCT domain-containing protein [Streptomyces griseocarneus]